MSRGADFLGLFSPSAASVAEPRAGDPSPVKTIVPGAALGVFFATRFPKHPFLAFLGGDAIGVNAYRMWRGEPGDRSRALANLGVAGAGIAGSLLWKSHPFWGWVLGFGLATALTTGVQESSAHRFFFGGAK